ncbi:MAG: SsrA-binding protein SmpB [Planctomycetota bacterium]|jgi:SsrA-binding protein|nr:SsrA-binding protein SmpB [Planctomycetota bacterium]
MSKTKVVARNKRARHDYAILETIEAGLVLLGGEVKSIRDGRVSIAEAFGQFKGGELFLRDMHIPEYSHAGYAPHEPRRPRKLLLHGRELNKLETAVTRGGLTMVPLQLYFLNGRAKVEMALVRGRKRHDKREALKGKAAQQEIRRATGH